MTPDTVAVVPALEALLADHVDLRRDGEELWDAGARWEASRLWLDENAPALAECALALAVLLSHGGHASGCGRIERPHMHRGVDCDEPHPCDCGHRPEAKQEAYKALAGVTEKLLEDRA